MEKFILGNIKNIIPSIFDESLSYYEVLTKVVYKINEVIDLINDYKQNYQNYTDEKIKIVLSKIDSEVLRLINLISDSEDKINLKISDEIQKIRIEYTKIINENTLTLNTKLTQEIYKLNVKLENEIEKINGKIEQLKIDLTQLINNKIIDFKILDSTTGKIDTLQNVINNIVTLLKNSSLLVSEFENLRLTCTLYDNKNISAYDYDFKNKTILV